MTLIIGITGGIGSGKSTFVSYIKKKKFITHDSDKVVKEIYKHPTPSFKKYLVKIGLEKSIKKDQINKKTISNKIFSNKNIKKKLEHFVHKEVRKKRIRFIAHHKKKKSQTIFIDIPLLFEKNLDNIFDKIICILCSKETRLKRLRNKTTKDLFKKIYRNQTTDIVRKKRSDYCIYNNNSKINFYKKINKILNELAL